MSSGEEPTLVDWESLSDRDKNIINPGQTVLNPEAPTPEARLDLAEQNKRHEEYLQEAHEVSDYFAHKKIKLDRTFQSLPAHILEVSKHAEHPAPRYKQTAEELALVIAAKYKTSEDRQMVRDGMRVELEEIFTEMSEPEMERVADQPNPERNPRYATLCRRRDEALATIEYMDALEARVKKEQSEQEVKKQELIIKYQSEADRYLLESGPIELPLMGVLPQMSYETDFSVSVGYKRERTEEEKKQMIERFQDEIDRHYRPSEIKLLVQALREQDRAKEAEILERFL